MISLQPYDVISVGGSLSSYLLGAMLANSGKRVLVVDDEIPQLEAQPLTLYGIDKNIVMRSCLKDLGLLDSFNESLDFSSDLNNQIIQVLTPAYRIILDANHEKTFFDFKREFPNTSETMSELFLLFYNASKSLNAFADDVLSVGQLSFSQKSQWKSYWGPYSKSIYSKKILSLDALFNHSTLDQVRLLSTMLLGSLTYISPLNIGAEQAVRGLSAFMQKPSVYKGGVQAFKNKLKDIILSSAGTVREGVQVESVITDKNQIQGVHLSSYEGIVLGQSIVLNSKLKKMYLTLPEQIQDKTVVRSLNAMSPSHWRYSLDIQIPEKAFPVGASAHMCFVRDTQELLEEENFLILQKTSSNKQFINLKISCLVPIKSSTMSYTYLRNLSGKMLHSLNDVIPFFRENIFKITPDFRVSEDEIRKYYPFTKDGWVQESLIHYYLRGIKGVQSFWGPSWSTPHKNLFFSGRSLWPSLGILGEFLSARKIYEDLIPSKKERGEYRDQTI